MNQIQLLLKLCVVWIVSWAIGCFISAFNCVVFFENYAADCAIQTAIFSFVIIMPCFPILYLPVLFGLRRLVHGVKPKVIFPLVSAFLYLIPLGWIYLSKSRTPREWVMALVDPSGEFNVVLLVTGFTFGIGFVLLLSKHDAEKTNQGGSLSLLS